MVYSLDENVKYYYKYFKERKSSAKYLLAIVKYLNDHGCYDNSIFCKKHKMKGPMRVYYDEEGDFLEISIGKPAKSYAEEVKPGIFIRIDEKTEEVKSIGIFNFKKRAKSLKDIKLELPIEVNFSALN